jgi:hypothetical protein
VEAWLCNVCTQLYLVPACTPPPLYGSQDLPNELTSLSAFCLLIEGARLSFLFSQMSSLEATEDAVVEVVPTLCAPVVQDVRTVAVGHERTSTSTIRHRTEQDEGDHPTARARKPILDHEYYDLTQQTAIRHSGSGDQYTNSGTGLIFHSGGGTIHLNTGTGRNIDFASDSQSLFDPLVLQGDRFSGQQIARIKESKASYRTARLVSNFCTFKGLSG